MEENNPASPSEAQNQSNNPIHQNTAPPTPNIPEEKKNILKNKRLIIGIALIVILFISIGLLILGKSVVDPKSTETAMEKTTPVPVLTTTPILTPTIYTSPPISTSDWETYSNNEFGISFKHPTSYEVINSSNESIVIGIRDVDGEKPHPYLYISKNKTIDIDKMKECSQKQIVNTRCLTSISSGYQDEQIAEIRLDTVGAITFITTDGPDNLVYNVQTTENPSLELRMSVAGGGLGRTFEEILSTFKFAE